MRGKPRHQRRRRAAQQVARADRAEGLLRVHAREVQERHQRRESPAISDPLESRARRARHAPYRGWLEARSQRIAGAGTACRRPRLPRGVEAHEAHRQDAACAGDPAPHRRRDRCGFDVRRACEAHSRVQAPAPEHPARGEPLRSHQARSQRRNRAAHCFLRRQGGPQLLLREAHHPADQRRRAGREQRSAGLRPAPCRIHPELQRKERPPCLPGCRSVRADLDGGEGGFRHGEHEVRDERRVDDRHAGWRQHRDTGRGGRRKLLPVRPDRRRDRADEEPGLQAGGALCGACGPARGDRSDPRRRILERRPDAVPPDRGQSA